MKSLVYIDACMRKDSRTRRIAKPIISQLSERYTITKFVLNELPLEIVKEDRIQQRMHGNYYISLHVVWIFLPMIHSNWPHLI